MNTNYSNPDHRGSTAGSLSDLEPAVFDTNLNLPNKRVGKVRDTYTIPPQQDMDGNPTQAQLVIVASDRISAFDVVIPTAIPGKGKMLTEIATFWLRWIEDQGLSSTHLISTDVNLIPDDAFNDQTTREMLEGRTTIGRLCKVIPVECVVRGYLEGSGLKDYQRTGSVCGVSLPEGLRQCDRLPEPIFTPATKEDDGHDENIGFEEACAHIESLGGRTLMEKLRDRSLNIYVAASAYAKDHGIILADTKFEFGLPIDNDGNIISNDPILIDEALTPDSSRFWPAEEYTPGQAQKSFDKQYVREFLQELVQSGGWNKTPPGPALPDDVVLGTLEKYAQARDLLVGTAH
ncbi:MAG: phosphoribosylaminoimidazolesuccinocarboxamide synthase [Phycisphaerales bacterium]|nr:phosphoribosylaminoimidazolesuccinocarboxamide synthase [Phycisphaerales bacterium]